MTQRIIGGFILLICGIMLAVNPRTVWAATEKWGAFGKIVTSKAFVIAMRVIGALCAVVGLLVVLGIGH